MQVEIYEYKWSKKETGYYQSTTNFPDNTRHWLHQEVYLREVGDLLIGMVIHHKDHNKDNNSSTNLEQLDVGEHTRIHMSCESLKAACSERMKDANANMQVLAILAKKGVYVGKNKTRKLMKGNKHRICEYCSVKFTLKTRDRNDTKYCSTLCAQRYSKTQLIEGYSPLANSLFCRVCNTAFVPKAGNQFSCSNKCTKEATEAKRKANNVIRECVRCSDDFKTVKSSKRKYCSVSCRSRN
jgi:hypothetical protein